MKVAVTGANSFVGSAIVEQLAIDGYDVFALARRFDNATFKSEVNKITISSFEDYISNIPDCDVVIHCAWMGTTQDTRIDENIHKKNYEDSMKMIANLSSRGIKKVILAGSQAEYGPTNGPINEESAIKPNTAYGKYKNKLYVDAKESFKDMVIIDARIFSTYGPGQDNRNMVPAMLEKMLRNEECLFTPATQKWNYLFIDDAAKMFSLLCSNKYDKSDCLNLASNDTRELKSFIKDMVKLTNTKSNVVFGAKEYNTSGYVSLEPDITKLLKFFPNFIFTNFKDGINKTIKSIKEILL